MWGGLQTLVSRLDELIGGPETLVSPIQRIVIPCRLRRLDLFQRHTSLDHVQKAVSQDGLHITVLNHIRFIAKASVAGDYVGAAFLLLSRYRDIDDVVQTIQNALISAAPVEVDDRITRSDKDVSRAHHVGSPEEYNTVAIRVRRGLMEDLDRLAIEVELFHIRYISIGRPRPGRRRRCVAILHA